MPCYNYICSYLIPIVDVCIYYLYTAQSQSESVGIQSDHQGSHEGDVTHSEQQTG